MLRKDRNTDLAFSLQSIVIANYSLYDDFRYDVLMVTVVAVNGKSMVTIFLDR